MTPQQSKALRHIIFDMDGTLADTAKATIGACAAASDHFGLERLDDTHIIRTIGIANPEFYFRLYPDEDRALISTYGQMVEALEADRVRALGEEILFPGVTGMLHALRDAGIRLYLASTGDQGHVDVVLRSAGIEDLFDIIACGQPAKIAMVGALIGNADRSEWAMIGDTDKDLEAARGNGILAIAAAYGYCPEWAWPRYDMTLLSPDDLVAKCAASQTL